MIVFSIQTLKAWIVFIIIIAPCFLLISSCGDNKAETLIDLEKEMGEQIVAYRTLLRETPEDPEILNNLAWLLAQKDDSSVLREAQILAEKACDKKSSDSAFQDTRGWIYWKQDMKESARQAWDLVASLDPNNTFIQDHLELLKGHN